MTEFKPFNHVLYTGGALSSRYVFHTKQDVDNWIKNKLPAIQSKYGSVVVQHIDSLDGLNIGDKCHVSGDGTEVYTILDWLVYSENRYGFILDSGFCEEIAKCYAAE